MGTSYAQSGVDIDKADKAVSRILRMMRATFDRSVINLPWGFAGLYSLAGRKLRNPVLLACTDGVGTKLKVAIMARRHDTVGIDLVAMSVNDLIVHGARPLFFLDYFATGRLHPKVLVDVAAGIAKGCRRAGCALLGGETAEMPGMYERGDYDLAGFAVGIAERSRILDGSAVRPGDDVIGIASSGLHSNGYSLVRRIVFDKRRLSPGARVKELRRTVAEELLTPTRIYVKSVGRVLEYHKPGRAVRAIAHVTGGGIPGNLARMLPKNCSAEICEGTWKVPPVFPWLEKLGGVDRGEMYRVFNMGLGMLLVTASGQTRGVLQTLKRAGEKAWTVGKIVRGRKGVRMLGPSR